MVARRDLLGSGLLGGVLGALGADAEAAVPQATEAASVDRVAREIGQLREELRAQRTFPEISPIRDAQLAHLRVSHKFPDFLELGTTPWLNVYDWHVRWQQPITLGRDAAGRAYMVFMQTALILRPDVLPTYIGPPYDAK